jgi:hypothetical protein
MVISESVNKGEGARLGPYADVLRFARSSRFYSLGNAVYVWSLRP